MELSRTTVAAAKAAATIMTRSNSRNGVLVSDIVAEREAIVTRAAGDMAGSVNKRILYRVDWATLLSDSTSAEALNKGIDDILAFTGDPKGGNVLYIDDISGFSKTNPLFGQIVADRFYEAIAKSTIRVLTASTANEFAASIDGDPRLRGIFEKIDIKSDEDSFVGDRLSPDLRDLVNTGDPNQVVKVILQAEDINNSSLRNVLASNGVKIDSKADSLGMMVLDLPVGVAEAVATARGSQHLSLDRQMKVLGHVETTTGASLVRTIQQGLNVGLLGIGVVNTSTLLDGTGIGIAVVDSGIRENHRSFTSDNG
ncbi:MAG: hypothetical protein ACRD43_00980, partial [Pyrinomonadaceae bacterium]